MCKLHLTNVQKCATIKKKGRERAMKTSKIDKLGRVVIPVQYRRALGLKENDVLLFNMENGGVMIRPITGV